MKECTSSSANLIYLDAGFNVSGAGPVEKFPVIIVAGAVRVR